MRLKKTVFKDLVLASVAVLFCVRLCHPEVVPPTATARSSKPVGAENQTEAVRADEDWSVPVEGGTLDFSYRHPILGVHSYADCFPDLQEVQYPSALRHGVSPVRDRAEAERRKKELLCVAFNPYYKMDPSMSHSIPYLVPRASALLEHISRRFLDSLAVKRIPLHTLIVTSVLRSEADVARLRRTNGNASEQSCHRFGTTFDISYNRYHTVSPPGEPARRVVRNDSLKYILCEVLRDVRAEGRCWVKYEVKQGCFHITVR